MKPFNEKVLIYQSPPGIYAAEDNSKAVYTMGDPEETLQIEYDDVTMKTKLVMTRFGSTFGTLRFDGKIFFFLNHWVVLHHFLIIHLQMPFMMIPRVYILVIKN